MLRKSRENNNKTLKIIVDKTCWVWYNRDIMKKHEERDRIMDYFDETAAQERRFELLEELRVLDLRIALNNASEALNVALELQSFSYDDEEFAEHQVEVDYRVQVVHDLEIEVAEALSLCD
jgi:hypothetical protein